MAPRKKTESASIPATPRRPQLSVSAGLQLMELLTEMEPGEFLEEIRATRDSWKFKFPITHVEPGDPRLEKMNKVTFNG